MFNPELSDMYFGKSPLVNYLSPNQNKFSISNDYFSNQMNYIQEWNRRNNAKNTVKTSLNPSLNNNNINPANMSMQSGNNSYINMYNQDSSRMLDLYEKQIGMMENHMNTQKALGITNTTMNAVTGLTQLGLGIDAYFQNRKLNKQAIKNAELSNQQLERDMEYIKNERNRLNRIRSNTNQSVNAKSSTSRVYA